MPSPEQLGVVSAKTGESTVPDWNETRRKLDQLGAVCLQLEKLTDGGFRFSCLLPTSRPQFTHRIDAVAFTESDVLRLGTAKAEEWAKSR
jgi:hypothetical protein